MKSRRDDARLKAEELERRMAPGRLGYVEPPEPTTPGGGGSAPVSSDPNTVEPRNPGRSGGRHPKFSNRD